jgi:hypothetical protein
MPALYALTATLAPAYMNMKLDALDLGLRYLSLILLIDLDLFQLAAAMRAMIRQFGLQRLVDRGRNRPLTAVAILGACLSSRLGGISFRLMPRERSRLTLPGPSRLFQSA